MLFKHVHSSLQRVLLSCGTVRLKSYAIAPHPPVTLKGSGQRFPARNAYSTMSVRSPVEIYQDKTWIIFQNLKTGLLQHKEVKFVTGNEAADADSIVSAFVLAFLEHHRPKQSEFEEAWLPLVAIPREDVSLRMETVALFEKLGLDCKRLIFADDADDFITETLAAQTGREAPPTSAPAPALPLATPIKVVLTDHNVLPSHRKGWVPAVHHIIDHHIDAGQYEWVNGEKRVIAFDPAEKRALVGSCCSLIAERYLALTGKDAEGEGEGPTLDPRLSTLLLGVILLDTMNLDPAAKKVTERDIKAAKALEKFSLIPKESLFQWLQSEKFNPAAWAALSVRACLKYDYKQFPLDGKGSEREREFGMSSTLISTANFMAKSTDLPAQLRDWVAERGIIYLIVLSLIMDEGVPRREMLLFCEDSTLLERVKQKLLGPDGIQVVELDSISPSIARYQQVDSTLSRKKLAPLFGSILNSVLG